MYVNPKKVLSLFCTCACFIFTAQSFAAQTKSVVNIQTWNTDKGSKVYFVELHELPIVDSRVIFAAGSAFDGSQYGEANLLASMLDEGTLNFTSDQIAEAFDRVGSQYNAQAGRDFSYVQFRSLSDGKYLMPTLDVFSELLSLPTFPEKELDRVKSQIIMSLKYQEQQPAQIAVNTFYSLIYGDQPYAHPVEGEVDSVKSVTRDSLINFHKRYYVAQNASIVLVGDLTLEQAKKIAQRISERLPEGAKAQLDLKQQRSVEAVEKNINFPSAQTTVLIGQIGINKNSPDYFPAYVGNYVLGGGELTSQLMKVIREDNGFAYHASSSFVTMVGKGPFVMKLQTRNAEVKKASDLAMKTLAQFIAQGPSPTQLTLAKSSIVQSFPLSLSSNAGIIDNVSSIVAYGLPLNYLDNYRENVSKVTKNDVQKTFKRLIDTQKLVTVTVGNEKG